MSSVGIIANPASGKDIRRLVAHASVYDNNEKSNILQRILLALDAVGVDRVTIMPDYYGLGEQALDGLKLSRLQAGILDMSVYGMQDDSTVAANQMCAMDIGCIIVLGGDGTNRVVAKGCGDTPIVPVSTGTNNVFPTLVEGTVAGLAAGLVARRAVDPARVLYRAKRLEVYLDGKLADIALIDVVTTTDLWIGTRAMWDTEKLREVVLARAEPASIGMASVGGCFAVLGPRDSRGMYLALGDGGDRVLAPVGPGMVASIAVREQRLLALGDEVKLNPEPGTIALDGERQIEVYGKQTISVRLTNGGPCVVDVRQCLEEAGRTGAFRQPA